MDPKQSSAQLDPKLKEAYDRVMNASTTPHPASQDPQKPTTPPSISISIPVPPTQPTPPAQQTTTTTTTTIPTPQPSPTIVTTSPPIVTNHREPEKIHIGSVPGAVVQKKKSGGIPVAVYIIGIIIFLAVYTVFWLKFFKIPLPFLPF